MSGITFFIVSVIAIALFAFSLKSQALEYFKFGEVYLGLKLQTVDSGIFSILL